ncbi:MAG: hypothetical protein EOO82_02670 [Oxalobacteraceae bacterium]|nr:MAG: hypothetical protein EOO82_02670 [Oxalobacteraceae bacterium]
MAEDAYYTGVPTRAPKILDGGISAIPNLLKQIASCRTSVTASLSSAIVSVQEGKRLFTPKSAASPHQSHVDRERFGNNIEALILLLDQNAVASGFKGGRLNRCGTADDGCGLRTGPRFGQVWGDVA